MRAQLILRDQSLRDGDLPFPGQNDPDCCLLKQNRHKQGVGIFDNGIFRFLNSGNADIQVKVLANSRSKRPVPNFRIRLPDETTGFPLKKPNDHNQGDFEQEPRGIGVPMSWIQPEVAHLLAKRTVRQKLRSSWN